MSEKKKVIIFGGTGMTGPYVIQTAVDHGHDVYAFVRTPSKLSDEIRQKITVIQGDVLDAKSVADAVKGKDAVLSLLGTNNKLGHTTLLSEGSKNITAGMKEHGVRKYVVMAGVSSLKWNPLFWPLRHIAADHRKLISALKEENDSIDWVVLHSPIVQRSTKVNKSYIMEKDEFTGRFFVTGGEIGDMMMKCVQGEEYNHTQLGISSGPAYISSFQLKMLGVSAVALVAAAVLHKLDYF